MILQGIESDVQAPNNRANIQQVEIQRTPMAGNRPIQAVVYERTESLRSCPLPDGTTISVPYAAPINRSDLEALGRPIYTEGERCAVLAGCGLSSVLMPRTTVDNIGVAVQYRHDWITPLAPSSPPFRAEQVAGPLPNATSSGWSQWHDQDDDDLLAST